MRGRLVVAALALVAAMVAAAAPVAHAASGAQLTEASGATFPAKTFVLTLPDRRDLRPNDVSLSENGQDVEGLRIVPGDAAGAKTFGTVLVIDTSESMRGAPIAAAMAAARGFAATAPGSAAPRRGLLQPRGHRCAAADDRRREDRRCAGIAAAHSRRARGSMTPRPSPCASYATPRSRRGQWCSFPTAPTSAAT